AHRYDEFDVRSHAARTHHHDGDGTGNVHARDRPDDALPRTRRPPTRRGGKLIVAVLFRRAMVEPEPPAGLDPVDQGIRLFNEEYFFEAHEVLDDLWQREQGHSK